jgi:hypothetical protein
MGAEKAKKSKPKKVAGGNWNEVRGKRRIGKRKKSKSTKEVKGGTPPRETETEKKLSAEPNTVSLMRCFYCTIDDLMSLSLSLSLSSYQFPFPTYPILSQPQNPALLYWCRTA